MNEQDKELALRIAREVELIQTRSDVEMVIGGIDQLADFAHRYHTAKLEQEAAEVVALREEVERLHRLESEHCADLTQALLTAQVEAKKLRRLMKEFMATSGSVPAFIEALSTPINTTEIDALVKDAERYRWLREEDSEIEVSRSLGRVKFVSAGIGELCTEMLSGTELDAAIDAAIKESGVDRG